MTLRKMCASAARSGARLCLLAGLGTAAVALTTRASPAQSTAPPTYAAFVQQVVAASAITDPLQRCLHMPDPPRSHWRAAGVEAYCRYRTARTLTPAEISQLVASGKAAEVDKAFDGYLHAQLTDPQQAGLFDVAIINAGFRKSTPAMRKTIDAWMKQRPRSAFAVAASGIQYQRAAADARGTAFASETSDDQWKAMLALERKARAEFDRAATMKPAVPSMYSDMFALGRRTNDTEYTIAALEKGLALDRTNLALRLTAASMSSRKWGGSEGWLLKLESDASDLAPEHPLLWVAASRARIEAITDGHQRQLPGERLMALADDVATATALGDLADDVRRAGRREDAIMLAVESLRFDDSTYWALFTLGKVNAQPNTMPWANELLRQAAAHHPDDPEVLGMVGIWLAYADEKVEGMGLRNAAFDKGVQEPWILRTIGRFYLSNKHYDRAAAAADRLIQTSPSDASGYRLRADVQIATDDPARYESIHAYLDRFADDADEADDVAELKAYLQAHPKPSAKMKSSG